MSDELEQQVKDELRRVDAPEGFADRVMLRVQARERARVRVMPRQVRHFWQAVAAVALIGALLGAGEVMHQRHERERAEVVQRQFDLAMQITQKTLDGVSQRISDAGVKQDREEQ